MFRGRNSALDYFLEYEDQFSGMTRTELRNFDDYLYRKLCEFREIEIAIPKVQTWRVEAGKKGGRTSALSESDIEKIVSSISGYDYNPNEAAKHLPYSSARIRRACKIKGIATLGRGCWKRSIRNQ